MDDELDVLVVGAGPIGLETAWLLGRCGLKAAVIDRGAIGATMRWWAPGTKFFSSPERIAIAGVPMAVPNQEKATREDYLGYLVQVARAHSIDVRTFTSVDAVERSGDGFTIVTSDARSGEHGLSIAAKKVVLAIGNMHRPRLLGVPGENGPNVNHYLRDPMEYVGRRVLIVGGKNSAVEAAIRLYRAGAHVTVSYRRAEFDAKRVKYWLRPELEWLIGKQKIAFVAGSTPIAIDARGAMLATPDGQTRVDADDVLLLTGYEQDTSLFERVGIELKGEAQHPSFDRKTMETNVPGVYVAGTAVAGTEKTGVRVFIENAHVHAARIARSIAGTLPDGLGGSFEDASFGDAEES